MIFFDTKVLQEAETLSLSELELIEKFLANVSAHKTCRRMTFEILDFNFLGAEGFERLMPARLENFPPLPLLPSSSWITHD